MQKSFLETHGHGHLTLLHTLERRLGRMNGTHPDVIKFTDLFQGVTLL